MAFLWEKKRIKPKEKKLLEGLNQEKTKEKCSFALKLFFQSPQKIYFLGHRKTKRFFL